MKENKLLLKIEALEKRIRQLECPHYLQGREFRAYGDFISNFYNEKCSYCDKIVASYSSQEELNEAKIEWHKEMIVILEVQDDKKSNL